MSNLNDLLCNELFKFHDYLESNFEELSDKPVTSGEIAELGKEVFYLLDAFREHIIDKIS